MTETHSVLPRVVAAVYVLLTLAWAAALWAAPWLLVHRHPDSTGARLAAFVYAAGAMTCHQRPARSFDAWGLPLPVCARCTGLYLAAPLGALVAAARRRRKTPPATRASATRWRLPLLAAAVPSGAALAVEWSGAAAVPGLARAIAALPLGFVVAWAVGEALLAWALRAGAPRL